MIRSSYDSQGRILSQNTSNARSRQVLDSWIDRIRGASTITAAGPNDVTFTEVVNGVTSTVRFWKSGTNILRTVDGLPAGGQVIVRDVGALTITYWSWDSANNRYNSSANPAVLANVTALDIRATVSFSGTTRSIISSVKLRQRRLNPNA